MARIVFAAPGVDRFHFHDRLGRELQQRGHAVTTLHTDRAAAAFWTTQGLPVTELRPERPDPMRAPLRLFAERECVRLGLPAAHSGHRRARRRIERRLARILPAAARWLEVSAPDLLVLHGTRTAEHQLLHFVARELGHRVLWTGDGLLPHTLQYDERGIEAEATAARRDPFDYRHVRAEPELLDATLAALLAHSAPFALPRRELQRPALRRRLGGALAALGAEGWHGAVRALRLWRSAAAVSEAPWAAFDLPSQPFVAVLLQHPADERSRLDAPAAPSPHALVTATARAARGLERDLGVVAVLPERGLHHRELRRLLQVPGLIIAPAAAAREAAVTATAVTTINHPLGIAALLAGTPVLHAGRALYGLAGVTWRVPTDGFARTLRRAVGADECATLRARFLTWLIGQCHVWCSTTHPDHNGMLGLVQEIEARVGERRPRGLGLHYRNGPAWPLSHSATLHPRTADGR